MAHYAQQEFLINVRRHFLSYFIGKSLSDKINVIDFGSQDINGNNRFLFFNYNYTGVDIGPGNNVDIVSKTHEFQSDQTYDIVISTEALEHDMFWEKSIQRMVDLLKPGKLMLITCASTGRPEHGTVRSEGKDAFSSPLTANIEEGDWMNYYRNITEYDIRSVLDIDKIFASYQFFYNPEPHCDLYFYGLKAL
jgi:SAM-dependent methyltransferase